MGRAGTLGVIGGVSLLVLAVSLPAISAAQGGGARSAALLPVSQSSIGGFTPAVRDPRLAAELARRGTAKELQFTPATTRRERNRPVQLAVRVRPSALPTMERPRPAVPGAAAALPTSAGTAITPSSYNLGASVGLRRFAITGDVAKTESGIAAGARTNVAAGIDYQASRRITGRVQIASERAEGVERIVGADGALSLDVAGSYSIARNIDVTGGVRYRVSRDRLEPLARDERRDSQSVYIGTAVRF